MTHWDGGPHMSELDGKVALVTGAARGLGKAIIMLLAQQGATVHALDRDGEELSATAATMEAAGLAARPHAVDATDEAALIGVRNHIQNENGQLDILVNNAGGWRYGRYNEISLEDWHWTFNANVLTTFLCTRVFAEMMVARHYGRIVNIASVDGYLPKVRLPHYAAAKAAVISLTKTFAEELGAQQILVNAVAPGGIATETAKSQGWLQSRIGEIPLGRNAEPEDIADVVLMLASDRNRFVTGETVIASGGAVMR
jgi:NAD(P)-dependent dehydrogenase (short-subunit alcohol dehydrogenase family)